MMDWGKLMSSERFSLKKGDESATEDRELGRSPFHKDYDRIVFSASFRRLGRKTQVHPLAINDHIHTRLTHSLEVSSVGRSLALMVHAKIKDRFPEKLPASVNENAFGTVVQSACLAHDLGNPPFGHAGEFAMREWFEKHRHDSFARQMDERQISDFVNFEGNAQGFRILTKLEYHPNEGGMQLTKATLGTMIKYPCTSLGQKKYSVYESEKEIFDRLFFELGIPKKADYKYARHPLSYLMEAADDICYALLDLEDAVELGILNYSDIKDALNKIYNPDTEEDNAKKIEEEFDSNRADFISFLSLRRGKMMSRLIAEMSNVFMEKYDDIMNGNLNGDLIKNSESQIVTGIALAKKIAEGKIFPYRRKLELEIGSYVTISNLLDTMIPEIYSYKVEGIASYKTERILKLIGKEDELKKNLSLHDVIHLITDFISGMTDNYATYISKQITGHAI